jgi:hypothetical protein
MASAPTPPSTIAEYRRLAHAFLVGCKLPAGSPAYVVMSSAPPLYRVQGIYPTQAAAEAAVAQPSPAGFTWTATELSARNIYQTTVPDLSRANQLVIMEEGDSTESNNRNASPEPDAATRDLLRYENIRAMELRITVNDTVVTFPLSPETTALFITRGAAETFLFSHYFAYFGPEYATTRLARML